MEEKKVYSIVGTVTIGTDEYRDLIEGKLDAEKSRDEYSSKYWDKYREVSKLEEENKALKQELDRYRKFVNDNNEEDKMALWILKLSREE